MVDLKFRYAQKGDERLILRFIKELAEYEGLAREVVADCETLSKWIFDMGRAKVLFALDGEEEIGFALYFYNFSTFLGRSGIYLEDLYVSPEYRKQGVGKALLKKLARTAEAEGCGRLEWWCLDENLPSIEFYTAMGAQAMDRWTVYRVSGDGLKKLAERD